MSSTNAGAYGLPAIAPPFTEDRPLGEPAKFLVFHTAALSPSALDELLACINASDGSPPYSKLAPTPDFSNRPLRDVYDHFVSLREQDETVYPFYFIVADRVDFAEKGVLGVCLDCSQGESEDADVGVARCGIDMSNSWGTSFYHGIAGWEEMRESEMLEWGEDDDGARNGETEDVEPEDVDPEQKHADAAAKWGWDVRTSIIKERDVYAWYSLVEKALPINHMLDPLWLDKTPDQCRFQMLGNYHSSEDPWADICREHPQHASCRPRVSRRIILVAEKENADEDDGVAIVRLKSDRPPKVLARVSAGEAVAKADEFL
ncbi:hypothetical protein SVAN01_04784 [Stagonosporopsis vannaccii]|nr:hypothetical protein SVAN01_04784 [Stagonosporopsis vannaccii]